jgi:serine phosphatase RsbU (regulator of sigma subunit)
MAAVGQLLAAEAQLWWGETIQRLPGRADEDSSSVAPPTELMQRALDSGRLVVRGATGSDDAPALAMPLICEGTLLGVLQVQRTGGPSFSETEVQLFDGLIAQSVITLHAVYRLSLERLRCEQLLLVREVSAEVASLLDLDTLFNKLVDLLHERLGYPFVHLFTVDPVSRRIRHRAGSGLRSRAAREHGLSYGLDDTEGIIPWVVQHGETVLANDVTSESRYRPSALPPANTRAELAVPLVFGREVLGVLDVQSDRAHAFSADDRFLLEALADSIAIAIRNANLYRSEQWRRQVSDSLREVAGLLADGVDLQQVLDAILVELERILPCDAAAIWLLQNGGLCLSAARGFPMELCIPDVAGEAHPWLKQALHSDQPVVRAPGSAEEPLGATLGFPLDYSAIAAPLRTGGREVGLLTMAHRTPGRYGPESQRMTAAFASYAAVAIENARLYQAAQEQAYVSTVLLQVAEATQTQTTLDEVLETVVRLTPMLAGVERCALLLWDEANEAFVPASSYGLNPEMQSAFNSWMLGLQCAPAFALLEATRAPIFVPEVSAELGLAEGLRSQCGFDSPWLVPLAAHGAVLGALLIDYQSAHVDHSGSGQMGDVPLSIVRGIAYQAAAAIANTQLLQERQEEAYVSVALLQAAQAVVSLEALDDVLDAIVHITSMLAGAKWCVIFLWDDEHLVFRPSEAYGFSQDENSGRDGHLPLPRRRYTADEFPLLTAVRERDSLVVYPSSTFTGSGDMIPPDLAADFGLHEGGGAYSLVAAPLSVMGNVLGVLLAEESEGSQQLRARRLELITGIARQAALAVQNDRLLQERAGRERLDRELQLAHELQHTFLPSEFPSLQGWELAAAWRAAREVGGDFYDFFQLPGNRLGLAIADVADKGMPAALFMILTRTLVRAAALESASPASVLARVNDLLAPDAQEGMFVTAAYGVLDLDSGQLTYASAGHNPALLLSRAGETEWLRARGTILGVLDEIHLDERTITLEPGDSVIFYTDGVTEAFSEQGDIYGQERLRAVAKAGDGSSAQAIVQAVLDSVQEFAGDSPQSDDLTLMILRRLES